MRWFKYLSGACALFMAAFAVGAHAQQGQPMRLVVPYPAGGPTDVVARALARPLAQELGRPVVVDNRAGASGTIGAGVVARAPGDTNLLLLNTSIHINLPHLTKVPYDTLGDFTPIGQVNSIPFILVINKDLPFRNLADLIAYAKANPGRLNFATNSPGAASHLAAEQFKRLAGVDLVHVPYKGSAPAITDLIGGQVQMMFEQGPSVASFLKSGQLRALAVTSATRSNVAPDVPTFAEAGLPFSYTNWQGIWAPPGLSEEAVSRLTTALRKVLQQPEVRQRLQEMGTEPSSLIGRDFAAFVKQQHDSIGEVVRFANIKID
ncbi:MAG: Bug family tripartite tricarboxylate transporter substrate binding protein [Rubrivivax sp.]